VTAEYIATFLFLFCTIGCVVFTQDGGITTARQLEVSFVFGGMITILVYIMAGISGGNINPAVSLALALTRKISWARCVAYTAAQCLGAICGAGMVRVMTPALFDKVDGGANEINANASVQEAIGVEFGCTFLLVMTVMAATDGVRAKVTAHTNTVAPLIIGLAVTVAHFVAIPVDNCSINPARSFGVSAVSGMWDSHAVFWFGPYLGATAAAIVYTYVLEPQVEDHPLPPESAGGAAGAPAATAPKLPAEAPAAPAKFVGTAAAPEAVAVEAPGAVADSAWS